MNNASFAPDIESLRQQATALRESGRLEAALDTLDAIISRSPGDTQALIEVADILFQQGHFQASSRPLLFAAGRLPRNAPLILALVEHLIARGEILAARACLALLDQAPDAPPEVLVAQAQLRFALGEIEPALMLVSRAIEAGADAMEDLHLHAMLLQFSGRIDEATAVLERCLDRWPTFGDAAMVLVNLRRQKPEDHRLEWLDTQLAQLPAEATADAEQSFVRAEFEYARFKTLDDLGRHDEAWEALARCNARMAKLNAYDAETEEAIVSALAGITPASPEIEPVAHGNGPTPIFIVGLPRSGTTLLDRMLSSHSQVSSAGEIIEFWRQLHWVADVVPSKSAGLLKVIGKADRIDYRLLGQRYLNQTRWRAGGRAFYIDKLPANIQMVGFIRRALPHAPILHMVRDPMDTCFSNFKAMFGNVSAYSYDLSALGHHYGQYARLVRHWHDAMPGAMLDVSYSALVQDPAATLQAVLGHCGLAIEDACLNPERNASPVATPSSPQVRESIHRRGIGQWRTYERQLVPLRLALEAHGIAL
ncbi:MAG: sulfotransferase family protein [Lysobacterales bacterium 14-68-21]|jgi:tetratricopeptide (TPR) repeat protein|nr:MAG: sulfotransferase family protein [Xanthomonadales bacterium 15-68-25]OZB66408.1 MAG: sulfotransferase family protein [Xanthomonadales bacterium 14-68-21]